MHLDGAGTRPSTVAGGKKGSFTSCHCVEVLIVFFPVLPCSGVHLVYSRPNKIVVLGFVIWQYFN